MCLNVSGQAIPCNSTTPSYSLTEILVGATPTAVSSSNPMPISGSFSATLAGFAPGGSWAQLSVSASSSRVLLPSGTVVIVYNTGANGAYVAIGNSGIVATTGEDYIPSGGALALTVGSNTYIAGITSSATTTLNISGGSGLPTGWGAGGGGGSVPTGSAGSPNAAVVTVQGITGGTAQAVSWTGQTVGVTSLPTLPAGANTIGAVTQASGPWTVSWTAQSVGITGTLPAYASTPTFNLGTLNGAATAALQPTNAAQASTTSGQTGTLMQGAATTAAPSYTTGQTDPLSLDLAGNLRVNLMTAIPVGSNVIGAVTQSSTWTVQPGNTANTTPWLTQIGNGTNSAAIKAPSTAAAATDASLVVALSPNSPLATGANTIGTVNLGTIGGASTAALQPTNAAQGSTTSGQTGTLIEGAVTTAAPSYTTAQTSPLSLDTSGNLRVNVVAGGGSGGTSSTFGAAFPGTGTAIGAKNGSNMVNLTADASSNLDVNCVVGCAGGTFNNNSDAVATTSTNGQSASWLYGFNGTTWDRLRVDASKNLEVNVNAALPTGANTIGAVSQASGPWAQNITQFGSSNVVTGTGASGAGIPRVTVSNDSVVSLSAGAATIGAVTQASGPWTSNLTQVSGASISTASSGTQLVGVVGHAGAAVDAVGQNGSSPANELIIGGQFNTAPTTITSGNVSPLQLDSAGNLLVDIKAGSSGTSSSFGSSFPSAGTAAGLEYLVSAPTLVAGTMGAFQGDVSGNLKVNLQTAIPAGTNTVGNVGVNNKPVGAASIATAQVASVTSAATSILAARTGAVGTGRISATIYNNGTVTVFIGTSGVTTSTGIPLIAGAALTLDTTAAIYGIVSSTAGSVSAVETF
jgi:hypothetical protein